MNKISERDKEIAKDNNKRRKQDRHKKPKTWDSRLEFLEDTAKEYKAKAERYLDPDYRPSYADKDADFRPDDKIEYWTKLSEYYEMLAEKEKIKIVERADRPKANFDHVAQ